MERLALIITSLLAVTALFDGQDTSVPATRKPYARTGFEVTLSGTISLTGKQSRVVSICRPILLVLN